MTRISTQGTISRRTAMRNVILVGIDCAWTVSYDRPRVRVSPALTPRVTIVTISLTPRDPLIIASPARR